MNELKYIPGDLVMVKEPALQFAKDKIFKVISSLSGGFVKVVMCWIMDNTVRMGME